MGSFQHYRYSSPGGKNPLFPPRLEVPFLVGHRLFDSSNCEALRHFVLANEKHLIRSGRAVPVAGRRDGLTTRWLSYNVLSWEHEAIGPLKDMIRESYLAYLEKNKIPRWKNKIQCWANVLRQEEQLHPHHHNFEKRASISATVALNDAPSETVYVLPFLMKQGKAPHPVQNIRVPTEAGNILMMPGWVTHYTTPTFSESPRVTLGIDIVTDVREGSVLPFDSGRKFLL